MKSKLFLKLLLLPCAAMLWSSCLVPEDVVSSSEFVPLKTLSISPDSAKVSDAIVITGENFISKKEYNSVWFSPNVKAVIDSATKTQLFLKVPEGAVTGEVVVSNGGYADTVKKFTVKAPTFKKLNLSYGGIKVIMHTFGSSSANGGSSSSRTDTGVVNKQFKDLNFNFIDLAGANNYFINNPCRHFNTYSETALESFQGKNRFYTEISIDTVNKIIKKLTFNNYALVSENDKDGYRFIQNCSKLDILLTNVPYIIENGKKIIDLRTDGLKKYLQGFNAETISTTSRYSGTYSKTETSFNGIYEIFPDAYFELTLE